jgi:hypothetical protein
MPLIPRTSPLGQLLRRVPGQRDLAKRSPIVLTDRDRNILMAISTQGFLTTELIELVFFPEPADRRQSPCSRAYERLRQLWAWRFVDRIELPMPRSLGGRRPYLYTLGPQGEGVVAEQIEESVGQIGRRRVDRLRSTFVDHDLTIARFWAYLVVLLRSTRAALQRWIPERQIRARKLRVFDDRSRRWLPVLPDAAFEVAYPDGTYQACLLEVDMGTLTLARFGQKVRAFELEGGCWLADGDQVVTFEVLVVTHTRRRLEQLWRVTRENVSSDRWGWYSFATFDILDCRRFGAALWITAKNESASLLHDDAYAGPTGEAAALPGATERGPSNG